MHALLYTTQKPGKFATVGTTYAVEHPRALLVDSKTPTNKEGDLQPKH